MIDQLLELLPQVVTALTLVTAVFLTSLWLGMVLWTFRDIRSRSRDIIVQLLATIMVGILTLPGLLVYFLTRPRETLAEAYEHALEQEALLQAIEEPEVCSGCGSKVNAEFSFCPYCHTHLKKACPACDRILELDWNICPYCGTSQGSQIVEPVLDREIDLPVPEQPQTPPEAV
ncbi:MAG: zinc ribbon domain-containing protein [Anaerolineae bacterium]|nr:zinc ribbon domain-containing protein [Anaerolineae bacterium]